MKSITIIAGLFGLACGIVAQKLQAPLPASSEETSRDEVSPSSRTPASGDPADLISLSWDLRGDLSSEELLALPHGARLLAEMTLWSLKASPGELAAHWDRVIASGEKERNTLDHLMMLWVRRDPQGALAHTRGSGQEFRCYWALAKVDPQLALDSVDPKNKRHLSMVLRAIGQTDPEYAMSLLEKYPNHESHTVTEGISYGLTETDPAAAVAYSAKQDHFEEDRLRWWLAKDPRAAFEWSLDHQALVGDTVANLIPLLLEQDPDFFAKKIANLPTGKFKLGLLKEQAKHLAEQDPDEAFAFAESHEGPSRVALMESMGEALVGKQPELAHDLFEKLLTEQKEGHRNPRLMQLEWVLSLIERDPVAVMEATHEFSFASGEETFPQAEGDAFRQWSQLDVSASEEWVVSLERGLRRDGLLSHHFLIRQNRENADFQHLVELTDQFEKNDLRRFSISQLLQNWHRREPDQLTSYLDSAEATSEERELHRANISKQ